MATTYGHQVSQVSGHRVSGDGHLAVGHHGGHVVNSSRVHDTSHVLNTSSRGVHHDQPRRTVQYTDLSGHTKMITMDDVQHGVSDMMNRSRVHGNPDFLRENPPQHLTTTTH